MKIVTYNVNGIRQRVSQFGSLQKLLDSFDADIICFQETKVRRQELTEDLAIADGYESFFSCTRTSEKGRTGYSGVATFCRVKSAFSSCEVALPVAAEEGFTGLLNRTLSDGKDEASTVAEGLQDLEKDELLKVDNEGRCILTDHGHFVVFNVYGPRACADDAERTQFKHMFYKILERRWKHLMSLGRRIFVVGDLNIAPFAIDRCDAGPDFEKNEFRKWLRSLLLESGGPFSDVFRANHPDRREAYTCWASSTGAEQFNYGSRIDHILAAGSCLHEDQENQVHNFVTCNIKGCDLLTEYKRVKPGNLPSQTAKGCSYDRLAWVLVFYKWKGGWNVKLEGSDHIPVYTVLGELPDVPRHSTPILSSRYLPNVYGCQQTLVTVFMKRQSVKQVEALESSRSSSGEDFVIAGCSQRMKRQLSGSEVSCSDPSSSLDQDSKCAISRANEESRGSIDKIAGGISPCHNKSVKKARKNQSCQLSLRSFFKRSSEIDGVLDNSVSNVSSSQTEMPNIDHGSQEARELERNDLNNNANENELEPSPSTYEEDKLDSTCLEGQKNDAALLEWRRIQNLMQNSIPLCKGHKEPCVSRVVKKPGPTFGQRFYVCARAEGPSSNPEANCGYFKWASSKSKKK